MRQPKRSGIAALLALALGALAATPATAAPSFPNATPAPTTSAAGQNPSIAVDAVDPTDGIDPSSVQILVNGANVTAGSTLTPIAGGYRIAHAVTAPLSWGTQNAVEVRASNGRGNPGSRTWIFYVDLRYETGTIVLDTTHATASTQQVYDAYGLADRLAGQGVEVDWVIRQDKAYQGVDLTAQVDDAPNGATSGADGAVITKSYAGGPFLIRDPDPATVYNEAWDTLSSLVSIYGYAPNLDEVRSPVQASRRDVMFLTFRPRVATADDLATTEMDLARLPYTPVESPGTTSDPATVAGGGLFQPTVDPLCGRLRRYDLFVQGHYDWDGPNPNETAAIGELDQFIAKAGMGIFECASATIEDTAHWITEPGSPAVEGNPVSASYTPDATRLGHPFLQTLGAIPIQGGAFSIWSRSLNRFRPSLQNILVDAGNGDIGYVFGAVGSGKAYYMGGHQRKTLSDRRLVLNAILYAAVYPRFDRRYDPTRVVAGTDNLVTVLIHVRGGSISYQNLLEDRLDTITTFVDGSVQLDVPGSSHSYDPDTRALSFDLGDVNPHDYPGGILGSYQVLVHPPIEGVVKILDHTTTYQDAWGASYRYESTGCADVVALPNLSLTKSASASTVVSGATTRLTLRLLARNNHSQNPIHDVRLTDTLPSGVSFVPGSIQTAKGSADWGVSAPATLTWNAGVLVPDEEAVLTFQVDATPASAGAFLVNEGASASARDSSGAALAGRSNDVWVNALAASSPILDFTLTPVSLAPGAPAAFSFCARNLGATKTFKKNVDRLVLTIPAEFGAPSNVSVPAGWRAIWDGTERTLTLDRPSADLSWTSGTSVCFGLTLTAPTPPRDFPFLGQGTINNAAASFSEVLPVAVNRVPGVTLGPAGSASTEPCGQAVHPLALANTSNGSDVFNLTAASSQGYAVTFHEDVDGGGTLGPEDRPLGDSDRDGNPDTGGIAPGASLSLLAAVQAGNTGVPVTDTTVVTARSAAVPTTATSVTLTTSVSRLVCDITPDAPQLCAGELAILDAGSGFASHAWSTGETTRTIAVAPATTTTFQVTVTNASGCAASASESVTVHPVPSLAIEPALVEVCAGDSTVLDAGPGHASYLWSSGETTRSITVAPAASAAYSVTVTNAAGCSATASRDVTVAARPDLTIAPASAVVCEGESVTLDAGPGHASYRWSSGETTRTLTVTPLFTTTYDVTVTGPSGCPASASVTVSVNPEPEPAVAASDPELCSGQATTLDAGPGYQSYLWSTGETTASITVSPAATSAYSVTVTDADGCSASAASTVNVHENPVPAVVPESTSICAGNAATLDAGAGFASYLWSTGAATRTITVSPLATTRYDVTVGDGFGCAGSASATLTVVDRPVVTPPNPEICAGEAVTLDAGTGYASYLWSTGETSRTISVSPAATTTYDVTVTSAGCSGTASSTVTVRERPEALVSPASAAVCPGESLVLDAGTGFASYLWSTGETTQAITVAPATSTSYGVTVTNGFGCSASTSSGVAVHEPPSAAISPASPSTCAGGAPLTLDAGAGFASYLWSTGETTRTIAVAPAATTAYGVTVTSAEGCSGGASATVAVLDRPVILPLQAAVCAGSPVTLDAGAGFASYLWSSGETTRTITVSPAATTVYDVTVTASSGCTASATRTVAVHPLPDPALADPVPEMCEGTTVTLDAGPGFASYLWSTGETSSSILVSPASTTVYSVEVASQDGCRASAAATVTVHDDPQPQVTPGSASICQGAAAALDAGPGFDSYRWSTGETTRSITVSPAQTTSYTVTVVSSAGCPGAASAEVTVETPPSADAGLDWLTCPGTPVRLGGPALPGHTYSWAPPDGLDDPGAAEPLATPSTSTAYTVTVTASATGCSAVDVAVVGLEASAPAIPLGNVLLETRTGSARDDVLHHWSDVAEATDYDVFASSRPDLAGASVVSRIGMGVGRLLEPGAVSDGVRLRFYRVSGSACAPSRVP